LRASIRGVVAAVGAAAVASFVAYVAPGADATTADTVDTLSYFVNTSGRGLDGAHSLSQTVIGSDVYYVKWSATQFENYSYDDQNIYLREDRSDPAQTYTFSDGVWMKRRMTVGETVSAGTNRIQGFAVDGTDCTPTTQGIQPYRNTLVGHETRDLGGELGVRDVIVLRYDYRIGTAGDYEQMYYARGLGWVRWELYRVDTPTSTPRLVQVSAFDRFAAAPPTAPNTAAACRRLTVPQRVPSLPTSADAFVDTLYRCMLGKKPDDTGFQDWAGKFRRGVLTAQSMYTAFFGYQGAVSDDTFARSVYACVLYRDIDSGTYATITKGLAGHTLTRPQLVQSVLGSAEFTGRVLPVLQRLRTATPPPAPALPTSVEDFVGVLYRCVLAQQPDQAGLRRVATNPASAYTQFFTDQGPVSDDWFARTLYSCALYREIDPGAAANIERGLATGSLTRPQLVQSILGSAEFAERVLPTLRTLR
jgi:hypothetical protein